MIMHCTILQDVDQTTEFEKLMDKMPNLAEKFLPLYSKFLSNKYPSFVTSDHFPISELLNGRLWSNVIKLFGESRHSINI